MPETKPETGKADTKPDRTARVGGQLAPAAESSDPAVHQLLGDIQTAQMNDDKDAEAAAREDLRALGYE
jgi:hypothetical protein